MRILLLAQWYPPIIGGEENHVRNLGMALAARGHTVSVATLAHAARPELEVDGGVRVHRLRAMVQRFPWLFSTDRQSAPPAPDAALVRGLRSVVAQEQPQIVHAHNWMVHSFVPLVRGGEQLPRLVLTLHDYSLICAKKSLIYRERPCSGPAPAKCLRCAAAHYGLPKAAVTLAGMWASNRSERRTVDLFVAVSQAVADGNRLGESGLRHEVVPNFIPDVDAPVSDQERELLAQLPSEPFILFVGGMARVKGIDVLVAAYRELVTPPPLVIIGYRGSERIAHLDKPPAGVTVLENWPHAAVLAAWSRSLLGVVPSVWEEPSPTVAMEALAAGRPVVASRIGGLPEIVTDHVTGRLVDPGDPHQLAAVLQQLVDDSDLRERMGAAARVSSQQFRSAVVVPRLEALYADLLAGGVSNE
jgi:glycosyltransferase involved in cell wall biosynthesis